MNSRAGQAWIAGVATFLRAFDLISRDCHLGGLVRVIWLPVVIGDSVWIGAGAVAVVLPGVTIRRGANGDAGTLVKRDLPGGAVVIGVRARAIDRSDYCIEKS